jgi:methyl-accepting chemotaxis protein
MTGSVSRNVGEAAKGAEEISGSVRSVAQTAEAGTVALKEALDSASALATASEELGALVRGFKLEL